MCLLIHPAPYYIRAPFLCKENWYQNHLLYQRLTFQGLIKTKSLLKNVNKLAHPNRIPCLRKRWLPRTSLFQRGASTWVFEIFDQTYEEAITKTTLGTFLHWQGMPNSLLDK